MQKLVRITRVARDDYREEALTKVRFVPLVGVQAWADARMQSPASPPRRVPEVATLATLVRDAAEPIYDIEATSIEPLLDRIGDAQFVLLGESTHGSSEFYRMRARISRELVSRHGFQFVAVEADWPDAVHASLPLQFDEYIWFDETCAVRAFDGVRPQPREVPDTYPFGV